MNRETRTEIENGMDALARVYKRPPKNVLVHVYRAKQSPDGDWNVDNEGRMVGRAVAAFVQEAYQNARRELPRPNLFMGAGLQDAYGGNPLYRIYGDEIRRNLWMRDIDEAICRIIEPHEVDEFPHGTKTELRAFMKHLSMDPEKTGEKPVVIARAPHMKRIKQLAKDIGLDATFISVEAIALHSIYQTISVENTQFNADFADFFRFSTAESIKLLFMKIFDQSGDWLEDFSVNHPTIKHLLLTALGHSN